MGGDFIKKFLFVLPLTFILSLLFISKVNASARTYTYFIVNDIRSGNSNFSAYLYSSYPVPVLHYHSNDDLSLMVNGDKFTSRNNLGSFDAALAYIGEQIQDYDNNPQWTPTNSDSYISSSNIISVWASGVYTNNTDIIPSNPGEPPVPEPGSNWLSDMWEWFLWQLGINDDYSGDIDVYITGGDRERIEYVTPTPSPIPPTPTPYDLNIIDPGTGQPVYTITGIPGSTTIINGGDTYNGSDFDIFSVDLQIGDGGTSNPKDGLNSVMESSNEFLKDVDFSPLQHSFSIIPSNWFLMIGVLAALPFIAGFIMRLLK